jgi:dephospho-CoA kinase
MLIIGLTGSIGMGKSATASMFRDEGIPVHDSDAVVHALYSGAAVPRIAEAFPLTIVNGIVDRAKLGAEVIGKAERMKVLESIVHPMVEKARFDFLEQNKRANRPFIILDIPLLFEIGGENSVDLIVVASAPDHIQEQRVLQRAGMTKEKFDAIRAKQLPNLEKCRRAHIVIDTSRGIPDARGQIKALLRSLAAVS